MSENSTQIPAQSRTLQTGVRFWPRRGGPFFLAGGSDVWEAALWDAGEVRDELNQVADAGFHFVRILAPWDLLQPDRQRLRSAMLDRLVLLLDACAGARLQLHLTVAGVLGSLFLAPRWALPTEPEAHLLKPSLPLLSEGWQAPLPLKNLYEDEQMLEAQAWLWGELARHLAAHPAFGSLDPGFGGLLTAVSPRHPEFALRWWERVRESEHAPPWRYTDSVAILERDGMPPLQTWRESVGTLSLALPVLGAEPDGQVNTGDARFWTLLAQSLARGPVGCAALGIATRSGAAPLDEETGAVRLATEEEQARAFAELLPALHALGVPSLCHTVWSDAPVRLFDVPPYAWNVPLRHAGLVRADGRGKEALRIWRDFNASLASRPLPTDPPRLDLDEQEWRARRHEPEFVEGLKREALG